jgi:hypothetical protein
VFLRYLRSPAIAVGLLAAAAASGPAQSEEVWSRQDAARLREKAAIIAEHGTRVSPAPLRTVVTESEINAYLAYDGREQLPSGVVEPRVWIEGDGRVSARALVDLDAVKREHQSGGWLDPMRLLSGRLPMSAAGLLTAADGVARFNLEKAHIGGLPIPKVLLQEVLTYYTRTADRPQGLRLDDPFPLPARIRAIEVRTAEAVVIQ